MDNFRRHKQRQPHRQVDGFITGSHRNYQKTGNVGAFRRTNNDTPTPNLGEFRRTDGFHPVAQPVLSVDGATTPGAGSVGAALGVPLTTEPLQTPHKRSRLIGRRHHRHRQEKHRNWKKISIRSSLALVGSFVIIGGLLFAKGYLDLRKVLPGGSQGAAALDSNVDPDRLNGEGDGRVNILLLGKGGEGHTAPDLTDTVLVASIDPIQNEAALLSIPRDLYVSSNGHGNMKINAVYVTAKNSVLNGPKINDQAKEAEKRGIEAIQTTVEESMGIPIHYHIMVDFEAFRKSIDTVGGVTINAEEALVDRTVAWENGGSAILANKGINKFNGKQALLYARSRHGSARGDFDRAERQRLIILALKDKVLSAGTYGNPFKVSQIVDALGDHVRTDLSISEVMRLYDIAKLIDGSKVLSLGLADPPNNFVTTANIGGLSVVVPRAGNGNFKEIQNFVRNSLKDGFIRKENAPILILNGTDKAGLATKKSEELKSYGYNVIGIADAPTKNYQQTTLVDLKNGASKYTKNYLENRLSVVAANSLPDAAIQAGDAEFVIIIGNNETTSQN